MRANMKGNLDFPTARAQGKGAKISGSQGCTARPPVAGGAGFFREHDTEHG
jgi:hypothetical protein